MEELKIGRMVLGSCQTNTYFVYRGQDAIVFDPADQGDRIYDALNRNGFRVRAVYLTHGHFDHIWGCRALVEAARKADETAEGTAADAVKIYACEAEREILQDGRKNISSQMGRPCTLEADVYVKDQDFLETAGIRCKVITTPGHTAGGCCYYFEEAGFLVSGDTLFQDSVGRTDFPTGSMATLVRSIREKLFILPEETKVYPGHGDSTTIGHEKKYNPFCV